MKHVAQMGQHPLLQQEETPAQKAAAEWDFMRQDDEACLGTFWRQATPGTTYWRCHLPALYLPAQVANFGKEPVEYDDETDILTLHGQRGVAIWQFLGDDGRSRFAMKQVAQGIPTVMELDDNYLIKPTSHGPAVWAKTAMEANQKLVAGNGTGYSIEAHKAVLPFFNALIVSTYRLAEVYADWHDNIFVCENAVDPTDWNVKREARETPMFGYYGSSGHARDFATMKKAFKRLSRRRPWTFIGFTPPGWSGATAPWEPGLMAARQNLGLIDIGVCPLLSDPFSQCKSDIKAMEYAMAGVMPIVSRTEPYRWWWDDQKWPWVAGSDVEWSEVLQAAAALSAQEVADEAAKAKALVLEHRTIQDNVHLWREVIDSVS